MLFLLAFLIGSAGIAMLILGEFTFRGKVVRARTARQVGAVLAALLPMYLLVRVAMHLIDWDSGAYSAVVFCFLAVFDLGVAGYLMYKAID